MELYIDDQDFTAFLRSGDDFTLSIRRDTSNGATSFVISSALVFDANAFFYLENKFFGSTDCTSEESEVRVILPCCGGVSYKFLINSETIELNPSECTARVNLIQFSPANKAFDFLRSKPWWGDRMYEDNDFTRERHTPVEYCEPLTFWNKIANVLTFGLISKDGCTGEYHPTPRVQRILEWNAERAGLVYRSASITGTYPEYWRMGLLIAQNRSGLGQTQNGRWIWDNAPIMTTVQLLELINPVFNAQFSIGNGELRWETQKYWDENTVALFDLEQEIDRGGVETGPTFRYSTQRNKAYGRFEYGQDATDNEGNRARPYHNDIVEWNPDGRTCLKGEYDNSVQLSTPLFSHSKEWADMVCAYKNRNNRRAQWDIRPGRLILTNGMSSNLKLLGFEIDGIADYTILKKNARNYGCDDRTVWDYNFPLTFRENEPDGLYQRFHAYSDPRNRKQIDIADVQWNSPDFCAVLSKLGTTGLNVGFTTPYGCAKAESLDLNFTAGTITFKSVKIIR